MWSVPAAKKVNKEQQHYSILGYPEIVYLQEMPFLAEAPEANFLSA